MKENSQLQIASNEAFKEIEKTKDLYNYKDIPDNCKLGNLHDSEYFKSKFYCHDSVQNMNEVPVEKSAIVTGFGPTNTPTAGTLSVMLKAISLQKETGIYTDIIISDLGAWNSRNLKFDFIKRNTQKFLDFIATMDFDYNNGNVRTHQDKNNLVVSGIISKIMDEKDFRENKEATDQLYDLMNLRGSYLGIMVDGLFTISDILKPLFEQKERVLVLAGIEEHYFARLARIAVNRLNEKYKDEFIPSNTKISALYARLINGLHPYPKMSKSIPLSSINIGDKEAELHKKIVHNDEINEAVVMQMIELVSNWSSKRIKEAKFKYENRMSDKFEWQLVKEEYFEYFISLSREWKRIERSYEKILI